MMLSIIRTIVWRIFCFSALYVLILILFLCLGTLFLFLKNSYNEIRKDFKSDFVDSKIDCFYRPVDSFDRSRYSATFSSTASEIAKRIEEEKRVLNLKMSAYG